MSSVRLASADYIVQCSLPPPQRKRVAHLDALLSPRAAFFVSHSSRTCRKLFDPVNRPVRTLAEELLDLELLKQLALPHALHGDPVAERALQSQTTNLKMD